MHSPGVEQPVRTEASELGGAKAYLQGVQALVKSHEDTLAKNQIAATQAARATRIERLERIVQERLYGNPDEKGSEREAAMVIADELKVTSGGKSYENLKSCYQDLIRLAIAMCYALSAQFRTTDRLLGGFDMLERLIVSSFPQRTPVKLHEDFTKASTCDADGKVTCNPLPNSLFIENTPDDLRKDLSLMNEFLVRAFLMNKGYEPDDDNVYRDKNGTLLTPREFERLKTHPEDGLAAYARKKLHIGVGKGLMGLADTPAPQALEPQDPTPEPPAGPGLGS